MQEFYDKWKTFLNRRFPSGCGGELVHGISLDELDIQVAGCIHTFVRSRGQLDPQRLDTLRISETELGIAVYHLTGEAKDYFRELHELTKETLAFLDGYLYQAP